MAQLIIAKLGAPWGDGKHLLKWRKAIGVGQVELAKTAGISQQLVSFIESGTQAFTESAKNKLWGAILRLGFERAKKGDGGNLSEWAAMLTAMNQSEQEKNEERKVRFDALQKQWMKSWFNFSHFERPAIESEMGSIVERDQSGLEFSKLFVKQANELIPRLNKYVLADIRKNPGKYLKDYSALHEWSQEILDREARGYAHYLKSEVEAQARRVAELEQELKTKPKSMEEVIFDLGAQGFAVITKDMEQERKQLKGQVAELEKQLTELRRARGKQ